MASKRIALLAAILVLAIGTSGCADFRDKFVRKKKEKPSAKRYYAVKTYHVKPSLELYTKRYVLWKNWQNELEDVFLADNQKKPRMAADQALSNLVDMQNMLVDEKYDQLGRYVDDMTKVEKTIRTQGVTSGNQAQLSKRIEVIGFEVQRRFSYNDMRKYIRTEFKGSAADQAQTQAVEDAREEGAGQVEAVAENDSAPAEPAVDAAQPQADQPAAQAPVEDKPAETKTENQPS